MDGQEGRPRGTCRMWPNLLLSVSCIVLFSGIFIHKRRRQRGSRDGGEGGRKASGAEKNTKRRGESVTHLGGPSSGDRHRTQNLATLSSLCRSWTTTHLLVFACLIGVRNGMEGDGRRRGAERVPGGGGRPCRSVPCAVLLLLFDCCPALLCRPV